MTLRRRGARARRVAQERRADARRVPGRRSFARVCAAAVLLSCWVARDAHAEDPKKLEEASTLFERGMAAQERGDYLSAANDFAQADALVPDPTALEAALRASVRADDPVLAMTLAERAATAPTAPGVTAAAAEVRGKFASRVGRVTVRCTDCRVTIDGRSVAASTSHWIAVGDHELLVEQAGGLDRRRIAVAGGGSLDIVPLSPVVEAPRAPLRPGPPPEGGLSPAWFWVGAVATVGLGVATIVSAVDTSNQHETFAKNPDTELAAKGKAAETRTNAFLVGTAVAGVATGAVAFFVQWSSPPQSSGAARRTSVSLGARGTF